MYRHITCGYSTTTIWGCDHIENRHTLYRRKDSIKRFCTSLRKQAKNIIDFEKKLHVTFNERKIKITSKYQSMLYYVILRVLEKLS